MKLIKNLQDHDTDNYYVSLQYHTTRKQYNIMMWFKTSLRRDVLIKNYSCTSSEEANDVFNKWVIYAHKCEDSKQC